MTYSEQTQRAVRHRPSTSLAILVIVGVAIVGVLAYQSLASSLPQTTSRTVLEPFAQLLSQTRGSDPQHLPGSPDRMAADDKAFFDEEDPAVANLNPELLAALRLAAADAAAGGISFSINDGWRSPKYQEQLLREAIARYGSAKEAARWVASPTKSAHVSGEAVDIGPSAAAAWLSRHGAEYGLCQIYRNEPWHYELRPGAINGGCPPMYADPTQDPRMQ